MPSQANDAKIDTKVELLQAQHIKNIFKKSGVVDFSGMGGDDYQLKFLLFYYYLDLLVDVCSDPH